MNLIPKAARLALCSLVAAAALATGVVSAHHVDASHASAAGAMKDTGWR